MFRQVSTLQIIGLAWLVATFVFFATQMDSSAVPPIAEEALSSLFLAYFLSSFSAVRFLTAVFDTRSGRI